VIRGVAVVVGTLVLLAVACGGEDISGGSGSTTATASLDGEIIVSAASSLTEAFEALAIEFEAEHPGTSITFNFGSSSSLSEQILDGAPADVFASADESNMAKLVDADVVSGAPVVFLTNELAIVVKPGNPEGVEALADLASLDVVALCGERVPCGRFAAEALSRAQVSLAADDVTRGQDAKATVSAVADGDADAGIVYVTDVAAAGDAVEGITIPVELNVIANYPMAVLAESRNAELAAAFVQFVAGRRGRVVFAAFGFGAP